MKAYWTLHGELRTPRKRVLAEIVRGADQRYRIALPARTELGFRLGRERGEVMVFDAVADAKRAAEKLTEAEVKP